MEKPNTEELILKLEKALEEDKILESTSRNVKEFLSTKGIPEIMQNSVSEILESENWEELNDRFHANLAFGTGGMRGRTIGKLITSAEKGKENEQGGPQFAAVGTNTLNEITLLRATKALYLYVNHWMSCEGILEQPRLVVAHDVRHFSEKFSNLVATTWTRLGGFAMVFDGPRSTPQLSFTVRNRYAHAGVVITASHNPYHDNGFKAYFDDGAQLIPPHVDAVVNNYKKINLEEILPLLDNGKVDPTIYRLQTEDDLSYRAALEDSVLDPDILKKENLKLVFTPIHGTGGITAIPALWDHGVEVCVVDEQNIQDPNFSTVSSPNPENPEALKLGISVAKKTRSDLVLGSDPDCDRIGVAARDKSGKFHCLSGNQIACLLAEYRILQLKQKKLLNDENASGFTILKTFVTSPMLDRIAVANEIKCINTPTGFKWMAQKLRKFEELASISIKEKEGIGLDYDNTDLFTKMDILSRYSTFVILAAEESYGYLPLDLVRDKDGNATALAIAELFAFLKSSKSTVFDYLDNMYRKYGYYAEKTENLYFEGAEGSETITKLAKSYREEPLTSVSGLSVLGVKDFLQEELFDEEKTPLPTENFLIIQIEKEYSIAIRPSGTEPKIKFYVFGSSAITESGDLSKIKDQVNEQIETISQWLVEDAEKRVK